MKVLYRGASGILVIDGISLTRDGAAVELSEEQVARLRKDPTVQIEVAQEQPRRRHGRGKASVADTPDTTPEEAIAVEEESDGD